MAALVAEGLTNREIAQRLFIDERTVEGHVVEVLGRLGLRRSQVGAWLARAGEEGQVPSPPGNLPSEASTFVGRVPELEELMELAERTRLLTLTGTGGVGKTRTALQLAVRLQYRFRGGAWLVDLSEVRDRAGVKAAVAAFVPERPTARTLVILDCCEHVLEAAADAARSLLRASDRVTVLATSRQRLGVDGEVVWLLGPMSEADALRLLEERASAAAPQADLSTAVSHLRAICSRLGGIPLAIELVAPRLRAMSPADLAAALSLELTGVLTSSGAPGRHGSVEAAIAWSYEGLGDSEQRLFRRLGIAAGPLSFEDAVALVGDGWTPSEVLSALLGLVEKSLVQVETEGQVTHYRLLDLVRDFAWRRLVEAGELDTAEQSHTRHFSALSERVAGELRRRPSRARATARLVRRHPVRALAALATVLAVVAVVDVLAQPAPAATVTTVALNSGSDPVYDMAFGPDRSLYYPDAGAIRRLAPDGKVSSLPGAQGLLTEPSAVQVARDGTVYVADRGNLVVRAFAAGKWQTVCGLGPYKAGVNFNPTGYDNPLAAPCPAIALALVPNGDLLTTVLFHPANDGPEFEAVLELTPTGRLRLYAGQGTGFSGDGGLAFDAAFDGAAALASDGRGNLYVADRLNNRVRRIDSNGVISTVAGNGTAGYGGDGGPAVHAQLDQPDGVALDARGNLYISELGDDRIRRVDSRGVISTVAGTGLTGYGGDGGSATQAAFAGPMAMAVDLDGNLYVDDVLNKRIRKITFRT